MDASLLESVCLELAKARPGSNLIPNEEGASWPDACALDYGAYFDLALPDSAGRARPASVIDEAADYLTARISRSHVPPPENTAIPVSTLSSHFYSPTEIDRLTRWWDVEPDSAFGLTALSNEDLGNARAWTGISFDVLEKAMPDLSREIRALIRQIVVARPDGSGRPSFGASSSFALWGSMVIDYVSNDSWPLMCRTIVHEAAHNLLFALAREEPLVENDPDERYPSPVRLDPRPMDGVYHAAFVSARECMALDQLLGWNEETNALDPADAQVILKLLEMSLINFWKCAETLHENARFTALGTRILKDCESYVKESFALKPA